MSNYEKPFLEIIEFDAHNIILTNDIPDLMPSDVTSSSFESKEQEWPASPFNTYNNIDSQAK